nr:MAG TPA: hypothetical protein [Caudoviricetes sp.]
MTNKKYNVIYMNVEVITVISYRNKATIYCPRINYSCK